MVREPPFVVVIDVAKGPVRKLLPMRVIPAGASVLIAPKRLVVPLPASWVMELALIVST